MPVNYKPVPDVPPQLAPTPSIREDVPHVRFSGAVGEALEYVGRAGYGALGKATEDVGRAFDSLGKNFEGAGKEIFDRAVALKALESDKKVDDLVIAYNQKQSELGEKFRTQMGDKAGPDALTAHLKQGADLRVGMRNGLTQYEQRKFDSETRGIYQSDSRLSVGHSSAQVRHSLTATNEAKISMEIDRMGKSQTNEELKERYDNIERLTRQGGDLAGKTPEQLEHDLSVNLTKGMVSYISTMSDGDPKGAMELLEANKDKIVNPFYDKLKDEIQGKLDDRTVRLAAQAANQNPEATLAEKEEIARKEAAKTTNDPKVIDRAIQRTKADNVDYQRQKLDQERRDNNLLDGFAHGRDNPEGKLPTRLEEVNINPDTKAAYSRLSNRDKDLFEKQLQKNSLEDYAETPEEVQKFRDIRQKSWDPENFEWFRNLTLRNLQDLHLSRDHRKQLLARQDEIEKQGIKAMDNPHVRRAEGILKAEGLIPDAIKGDVDQMNRLRGVLHDEIDIRQKIFKRELTSEEIRSLGLQILSTDPDSGFHGWFTKPIFEKMSEATKARVEKYKAATGAGDDEAMKAIAKAEYQVMFDKYHGKGKTAPTGAGPAAPQSQ